MIDSTNITRYVKTASLSILVLLIMLGCGQEETGNAGNQELPIIDNGEVRVSAPYLGSDLSYVNEMLDCGGTYRSEGEEVDPYQFFADKGNNLVRLRLWHTPDWTAYSDFDDIQKSIAKSKALGMAVLLDFHYSDDWADPEKQLIPAAWRDIESMEILGDSVYQYTFGTLLKLKNMDLLPEMVQIGNETNVEVMMPLPAENYDRINWERNTYLLNQGLSAVDNFNEEYGTSVETMLHIAQPENAEWWFPEAQANGIGDFDWIGLSYYPKWSEYSLSELSSVIVSLKSRFQKRIMIVETAYPSTFHNADPANNLLGQDALIEGFGATPQGQKDYMITLTQTLLEGGGEGVIYWEPAWISTDCGTRWGDGSHWDNATFFDATNDNEALPVFDFFDQANYQAE